MTCQDVHDALVPTPPPTPGGGPPQHAYYMGKCPVTCAAARAGHASVADAVAAGMLRQVGEDVYLDRQLHGIGVPDMCPAACGIGCGYAPKQDMADKHVQSAAAALGSTMKGCRIDFGAEPPPLWDHPYEALPGEGFCRMKDAEAGDLKSTETLFECADTKEECMDKCDAMRTANANDETSRPAAASPSP